MWKLATFFLGGGNFTPSSPLSPLKSVSGGGFSKKSNWGSWAPHRNLRGAHDSKIMLLLLFLVYGFSTLMQCPIFKRFQREKFSTHQLSQLSSFECSARHQPATPNFKVSFSRVIQHRAAARLRGRSSASVGTPARVARLSSQTSAGRIRSRFSPSAGVAE